MHSPITPPGSALTEMPRERHQARNCRVYRMNTKRFALLRNWALACTILGVISLATMSTDEAALIRRILGGRRDVFADLIAPHLPPLLRILGAIIGSHTDVED